VLMMLPTINEREADDVRVSPGSVFEPSWMNSFLYDLSKDLERQI
jgi:hypothetical protein